MKIIKSLLNTDLYKITMMQAVFHKFPDAVAEYKFNCRNGSAYPSDTDKINKQYVSDINRGIDHLCTLSFTDEALLYLSGFDFIKSDFIHILKTFRLNRDDIHVIYDKEKLKIIIKGSWYQTIMFEVPVLSIVSELYDRYNKKNNSRNVIEGEASLNKKINDLLYLRKKGELDNFNFVDMGT